MVVVLVVGCVVIASVAVVIGIVVVTSVSIVVVTSIGILVVVVVVVVVVVGIVVTSSGIVTSIVSSVTSGGTLLLLVVVCVAVVSSVASIAIRSVTRVAITGSRLVSTLSSTSRSSTTGRSLADNEITETSLVHEIKDTQAIGSKRRSSTALAKGRSITVDINIGVDERGNTTKLRSDRERSIATDVLGVTASEGVGVLLCGNHANSGSKGIGTSTEFSEDLVSTDELFYSLIRNWGSGCCRVERHTLSQEFAPPSRSEMAAPAIVEAAPASPP